MAQTPRSSPEDIERSEMVAPGTAASNDDHEDATSQPAGPNASTFKLKKLPPEILSMVLNFYFEDEERQDCDRGQGSVLFKALGINKELYTEALMIFYERYPLFIDRYNVVAFEGNFPKGRLRFVKHLRLELNRPILSSPTEREEDRSSKDPKDLHTILNDFITTTSPDLSSHNTLTNNRKPEEIASLKAPKLMELQYIKYLTIQFRVPLTGKLKDSLFRLDRITLLLENMLARWDKVQELRLVLLVAGESGFASNFWDKMNVLLGEGEFVRGMRRDGSGTVADKEAYARTDEWVWRVGKGEIGVKKVKDVRRGYLGEW